MPQAEIHNAMEWKREQRDRIAAETIRAVIQSSKTVQTQRRCTVSEGAASGPQPACVTAQLHRLEKAKAGAPKYRVLALAPFVFSTQLKVRF